MEKFTSIEPKAPKTVAAIHDLSCFGRCALSVVMPALSAMGIQVIPVPTALLSTHTGGFTDMYFNDLTGSMNPIIDHFSKLGLKFDAIYTGFLGSADQIDVVAKFIRRFSSKNTIVLVDPVMGDDGELYSTYTLQMRDRMYELCELADIITPNLTEASFLAGTKYTDTSELSEIMAQTYVSRLVGKLYLPKSTKIVVTGVSHSGDKFGTYGVLGSDIYNGNIGYMYSVDRVKKSYPGTGDLFASVLLGSILCGKTLDQSMKFASDHIKDVMEYSAGIDTPVRNGVAFEHFLFDLAEYSRS